MILVKNLNSGEIKIIKKPYIEIETIEQLVDLIKETDQDMVVGEDSIIIYDYYLE